MTRTTITANERLQLMGLLVLAKRHNAALKDIERAALAITGEDDLGHTSDGLYCDYEADEILRRLNITVEPAQADVAVGEASE